MSERFQKSKNFKMRINTKNYAMIQIITYIVFCVILSPIYLFINNTTTWTQSQIGQVLVIVGYILLAMVISMLLIRRKMDKEFWEDSEKQYELWNEEMNELQKEIQNKLAVKNE